MSHQAMGFSRDAREDRIGMEPISSNQNSSFGAGQVVDVFFRLEAGRMVSTLTRIFGLDNIELAEDVVQDAMLKALQQWSYGIPANPSGWIMQVAKNRALDILRRQTLFQKKEDEIGKAIQWESEGPPDPIALFAEAEVKDDQLRMIFACCHPLLTRESQVALTLKTLCGLGVAEIARSFLTSEETIAKRLTRAKQKLREARVPFEIPAGEDLIRRSDSVLQVLYLLFNEGYNASHGQQLIRWDLTAEAIRLSELLLEHPACNTPKSNALQALMLLHAARFPARVADDGSILLLQDQDRSRWNRAMIEWGLFYLNQSAAGEELSEFHLQAGIAACHSVAESYESTDWEKILSLHDMLVEINDSPVFALNRAVAVAKIWGPEAGLKTVQEIQNNRSISAYYLLHAVLAEFNMELGQFKQAIDNLRRALELTTVKSEQVFLRNKLARCEDETSNLYLRAEVSKM
ncbi:MAG: RNA polymerase sigma factor [Pyrinomonadaceae bacterium]